MCAGLRHFSLVAHLVKNLPAVRQTWVLSWAREDPLKKGKATHWRIPLTIDNFQDVFLSCVCVRACVCVKSPYNEIYPLHEVFSAQCNIVLYRYYVIHQISKTSCINLQTLYTFPLPMSPGSTFLLSISVCWTILDSFSL